VFIILHPFGVIVLFSQYSFDQHGCNAKMLEREPAVFLKELTVYYAEILNVLDQL
jgi:flavorubredoxin